MLACGQVPSGRSLARVLYSRAFLVNLGIKVADQDDPLCLVGIDVLGGVLGSGDPAASFVCASVIEPGPGNLPEVDAATAIAVITVRLDDKHGYSVQGWALLQRWRYEYVVYLSIFPIQA